MKRALVLALAVGLLAGCGGSKIGSTTTAPNGRLDVAIKVLRHGRQVIAVVPVTIDGKGPYTFALDTGASRSLMDTGVAKRLHVPRKGTAGKIAGINSVSKAALVKVTTWQVGQIDLPATTIVMSNIPFGNAYAGIQGLLGSDMLSRFDVVTIDYAKQQLRLHPR